MSLNWKNDSDYDFTEQLNACGWAFAFLRRDHDYIADYRQTKAAEAQLEKDHGPYKENSVDWRDDTRGWDHEQPINVGETEEQWALRVSGSGVEPQRTWFKDKCKDWGLVKEFVDPFSGDHPSPEFDPKGRFPLFPKYEELGELFLDVDECLSNDDDCEWAVGQPLKKQIAKAKKQLANCAWAGGQQVPGVAVVVFDLWGPLDEQIAEAKVNLIKLARQQMEEEKKKYGADAQPQLTGHTPGDAVSYFRRLLRVLDGVTAGAKHKQIAAILYPNQEDTAATGDRPTKRVYDMLQAARSYSSRRYLSIALMDFSSD